MHQASILLSTLVWMATLTACAADESSGSAQSAIARNFDALARQVTACADEQASCNHKALEMKDQQACETEYTDCRARAGKSAEEALIDAISDCQARANDCQPKTSKDVTEDRCEAALRACIGEASGPTRSNAARDAGTPSALAPTYQCFGQLRVCISDATGPKECAAEARACVLAAVEPPDPRRLTTTPTDAGTPAKND